MNIKIHRTIKVGDAGTPYHIEIDLDYNQDGNEITVIDWMEDGSPYDNPPELWYAQVKESIEDYFYDVDKDLNVTFSTPKPPCPCGVPNDLHSTTMCGWEAALMPSDQFGTITDRRHPGFGKNFMSWQQSNGNATIQS